jgi:hypothetical protein
MLVLNVSKITDALRMMNKGVKTVLIEHDGSSDLKEAAAIYANLFNGINSLDQYEVSYNYRDMSDYRVPVAMLQFVYPRSIKFDVSKVRFKDLLIRPEPPTMLIDLAELEFANNVYAKNIKEAKVETKPITDARIDKNLSDMIDKIRVGDKAYYTVEDAFLYPVVEDVSKVIGEDEFSKDVQEVENLFFKTFARKNS